MTTTDAQPQKPKYAKKYSSDLLNLVKYNLAKVLGLEIEILQDEKRTRVRVELPEAFYSFTFDSREKAREFLSNSEFQTILFNKAREMVLKAIFFDTQCYLFQCMSNADLRQLIEKIEKRISVKQGNLWSQETSERHKQPWLPESNNFPYSNRIKELQISVAAQVVEMEAQVQLLEAELAERKQNPPVHLFSSFLDTFIPLLPPPPYRTPGLRGEPPLTYRMQNTEYQLVQPETLDALNRILWITRKMQDSHPELHRAAVEIITYCLEEKPECQTIMLNDDTEQVIIWQEDFAHHYGQYNLLCSYREFKQKLASNPLLLEANHKETAASWLARNFSN